MIYVIVVVYYIVGFASILSKKINNWNRDAKYQECSALKRAFLFTLSFDKTLTDNVTTHMLSSSRRFLSLKTDQLSRPLLYNKTPSHIITKSLVLSYSSESIMHETINYL